MYLKRLNVSEKAECIQKGTELLDIAIKQLFRLIYHPFGQSHKSAPKKNGVRHQQH